MVPQPLADDVVAAADLVVTMGCGDAGPVYPPVRSVDWAVDDPAGRALADVRVIRDDVDRPVRAPLSDLGISVAGTADGR